MSYLGFKYVGLDRVILGSGYDVAADFKDSGGIFVNAEVTYRGVAVGRVSDMKLIDDGVRVVLTIKPDADPIPADTDAVVATRSAVGEQYVPAAARRRQGAVPQGRRRSSRRAGPRSRCPVEQLLLNMDKLANSIDQEHLRVVVDELGKAFAGAGDDLGRLIDNGDLLLARAEQSLPQTLKLITDGADGAATPRSPTARRSSSGPPTCGWSPTPWSTATPTCAACVVNAPDAGAALQQLVQNAGPGLGSLVRNLDILNKVTIPRLDGVEQMLITYPDVVSGGFSVVRNDSGTMRAHFGFVLNTDDPRACTTGYLSTGQTPSPGAVANRRHRPGHLRGDQRCRPQPGRRQERDRLRHPRRAEHRPLRGSGLDGPRAAAGRASRLPRHGVLDGLLGQLLHANPFARTVG